MELEVEQVAVAQELEVVPEREVPGLVVEGALAGVVVELEVGQVAVAQELEVVPEREVRGRVVAAGLELEQAGAAVLELALVQPQGQVLARVREPQSVLDLMHP